MPGRFAITSPPEAMRSFFCYVEQPNFPARYNIAPTHPVPILTAHHDTDGRLGRHIRLVRWGFLPHFIKDPKSFPLIINARSETLRTKASFSAAFKRRRCLFMADAFYEWRRERTTRATAAGRPYLVHRHDGNPMGFAGLWETWVGPNGEEQDTACIVTTAANGATAAIHDRLPAILEPESFDLWLDPDESRADRAFGLLKPPGNEVLDFYEIGASINKVANDSPDVQSPVQTMAAATRTAATAEGLVSEQGQLL